MMKKYLCVVFVLALIAQICAKPADEKVDPEEKLEDKVVKTDKDAKDKGEDVVNKATDTAKGIVDLEKKEATDTVKHGEEAANSSKKHGHGKDCHKSGSKGTDSGIITGPMKHAVEMGAEFVKRGEDIFDSFIKSMG